MKYLVNRETKEHYKQPGMMVPYGPVYDEVEADDEGWIKWDGGKRPLRKDCMVEVKYSADQRKSQMAAGAYDWQFLASRKFNIFAYRPILTVESKPTLEETWHKIKQDSKVDVFTRLYEAVVASESIPALIAEINAMLPEGYEVREKAKPEAVTEDTSNCVEVNGFHVGDFVECIHGQGSSGLLEEGDVYKVRRIQNGELVFYENDCSWMTSRFKRLSRPEAK